MEGMDFNNLPDTRLPIQFSFPLVQVHRLPNRKTSNSSPPPLKFSPTSLKFQML
jgi:hypothetical protein